MQNPHLLDNLVATTGVNLHFARLSLPTSYLGHVHIHQPPLKSIAPHLPRWLSKPGSLLPLMLILGTQCDDPDMNSNNVSWQVEYWLIKMKKQTFHHLRQFLA
jgi:hypothetical protein